MIIFKIFIVLILVLIFLSSLYFYIIRNTKVYRFRKGIYGRLLEALKVENDQLMINKPIIESILNKLDTNLNYDVMVFSFKALKYKYWFNEEEVNLLEVYGKEI